MTAEEVFSDYQQNDDSRTRRGRAMDLGAVGNRLRPSPSIHHRLGDSIGSANAFGRSALSIVFNGDIYNDHESRREPEAKAIDL
jgi:hypothetical protein